MLALRGMQGRQGGCSMGQSGSLGFFRVLRECCQLLGLCQQPVFPSTSSAMSSLPFGPTTAPSTLGISAAGCGLLLLLPKVIGAATSNCKARRGARALLRHVFPSKGRNAGALGAQVLTVQHRARVRVDNAHGQCIDRVVQFDFTTDCAIGTRENLGRRHQHRLADKVGRHANAQIAQAAAQGFKACIHPVYSGHRRETAPSGPETLCFGAGSAGLDCAIALVRRVRKSSWPSSLLWLGACGFACVRGQRRENAVCWIIIYLPSKGCGSSASARWTFASRVFW